MLEFLYERAEREKKNDIDLKGVSGVYTICLYMLFWLLEKSVIRTRYIKLRITAAMVKRGFLVEKEAGKIWGIQKDENDIGNPAFWHWKKNGGGEGEEKGWEGGYVAPY